MIAQVSEEDGLLESKCGKESQPGSKYYKIQVTTNDSLD